MKGTARGAFACAAAIAASLLVVGAGTARAVPKPPPKFWSENRCERVVLDVYGYGSRIHGGLGLPTGDGHGFHPSQAVCVASGGPRTCRWTSGHRVRLSAQFRVIARSPLNGGVIRSWTLATRAGRNLTPIRHHAGDQYAGWPPDFYMSKVALLATNATAARFRFLATPFASRARQAERTVRCSGR